MSSAAESRLPLVVRVKRSADEEPLDVLRLRPLPSKLARGEHGAFELHNLHFRLAGTIASSEPVAASTSSLIRASQPAELPVSEPGPPLSMEDQFSILREFRQATEQSHMFVVARKFRPVATNALGPLVDQMGRALSLPSGDAVVAAGSSEPRTPEDCDMSYAVCDLETVGLKRNKRPRIEPERDSRRSGITCNDEEMIVETQNLDSVYDIYVLHHQADIGSGGSALYEDVNNFLSDTDVILGTNSDNVFWSDAAESARVQEELADEEDSNDEGNWRNDYPDDEDSSHDSSEDGDKGEDGVNDYYGFVPDDHDYFGQKMQSRRRVDEEDNNGDSDSDDADKEDEF